MLADIKTKLETGNAILKSLLPGCIFIGGVILMLYFFAIGYFAYDISIGDGLYFVVIAAIFGLIYLLFLFCMMAVGQVAMGPVWYWFKHRVRKKPLKAGEPVSLRQYIRTYINAGILILAVPGFFLFFALTYWSPGHFSWQSLAGLLVTAAIAYTHWNTIFITGATPRERSFDLAVLVIAPLLLSGATTDLISGTMNVLNLRQTMVTLHLKKPYTVYADEVTVKGSESAFGGEYLKYEKVDVLFSGLGKNTVIKATGRDDKPHTLIIPVESVIIMPK